MPDTTIQTIPAIGMPSEIAKAINAVMAQVRSLPKTEHNGHAGYDFAKQPSATQPMNAPLARD